MTGALLIAIYLLALALFLGLDIVARVPPTLVAVVLAGLGALAGVSLLGGVRLAGDPAGGVPLLSYLATALGAAASVGGALAAGRSLGSLTRKSPRPAEQASLRAPATAASASAVSAEAP